MSVKWKISTFNVNNLDYVLHTGAVDHQVLEKWPNVASSSVPTQLVKGSNPKKFTLQ